MKLIDKEASLYSELPPSAVLGILTKGALFTGLNSQTVSDVKWLQIQDSSGRVGFILGSTGVLFQDQDIAIEEFWPRSVALTSMAIDAVLAIGGALPTVGILTDPNKGGNYTIFVGVIGLGIVLFCSGVRHLIKGYR
jgi:hypothetical protein